MKFVEDGAAKAIGLADALDLLRPSGVFGRALLQQAKPQTSREALTAAYDDIEACLPVVSDPARYERLAGVLRRFRPIGNTVERCAARVTLDEVELFELKNFILLCGELRAMKLPKLHGVEFCGMGDAAALLDPERTGTGAFYIYDGYSQRLAQIRAQKRKTERAAYAARGDCREERLTELALLSEREKEEELAVRVRLTARLSGRAEEFRKNIRSAGRLDLTAAKARLAAEYPMCRPVLCREHAVSIRNGVHPSVAKAVEKRGGRFDPVTMEAGRGATVITGANMGGKTVALRTVALNYLLACMGFFAFAEAFRFSPMDFLAFVSDGAAAPGDGEPTPEGIAGPPENGLSSFGGEAASLRRTLDRLRRGSGLILIDEFAKGTNPAEGGSLVRALVRYLNGRDAVSILATHYDGACRFAGAHYQVRGLKNVDFGTLGKTPGSTPESIALIAGLMDYTLEKTDDTDVPRDALNICAFFGIDGEILSCARAELAAAPPAAVPGRAPRQREAAGPPPQAAGNLIGEGRKQWKAN